MESLHWGQSVKTICEIPHQAESVKYPRRIETIPPHLKWGGDNKWDTQPKLFVLFVGKIASIYDSAIKYPVTSSLNKLLFGLFVKRSCFFLAFKYSLLRKLVGSGFSPFT